MRTSKYHLMGRPQEKILGYSWRIWNIFYKVKLCCIILNLSSLNVCIQY